MELLLDFFEAPESAAEAVKASRPVRLGVLAYVLGGVSLLFSLGTLSPLPSLMWLPYALGLWAGFKLVTGVLTSSVVHFVVSPVQDDREGPLFVLLGFSELVWTLLPPLGLWSQAVRWGAAGWLMAFLFLAGWSFWLKIRSIHALYGVSWLKAVASIASCYALFAASSAAGLIVWAWGAGSLFSSLFS